MKIAAIVGVVLAISVGIQDRKADLQRLTAHAWLIRGTGANVVVFDGADGKLLVDCKPPSQSDAVGDALARISEGGLSRLSEADRNALMTARRPSRASS